tara:strand:+ start:443 stop:1087 length:645 start_codon:yes stop_codon:yes gene_type:complete
MNAENKCIKNHILESGGWCLRKPVRVPKNSPGVTQFLPPHHNVADQGVVKFLVDLLKNGETINDFGAGVGQLVTEVKHHLPKLVYGAFDGAGNVEKITNGNVSFADLTVPLSLPRRDYVISLEVGEHISSKNEYMFVRNLHAHNCRGILLSWAKLHQGGHHHVNDHSRHYVTSLFTDLGYRLDNNATKWLRKNGMFWWMRENMYMFRRNSVCPY